MIRVIFAAWLILGAMGPARATELNCPGPIEDGLAGQQDVQLPRNTLRGAPAYPAKIDRARRLTASVLVGGTIDLDGRVGDVGALNCKVKQGDTLIEGDDKTALCAEFGAAAEAAFREWRYIPAKKAGIPVCLRVTVKFDF